MAKEKNAAKKAAPKKAAPKKAAPIRTATTRGAVNAAAEAVAAVATVHITFENTNPGTSNFKITHNNVKPASTGTSDDTVNFQGVQKGDTIEVSTDSPGDTTVTVSGVNTLPTKMTAVPGQHLADFFLVL